MATYYAKSGLSGGSIENQPSVQTMPRLVAKAFNYVITSNLTTSDTLVLAKIPAFATVLGFVIEPNIDPGTTLNCNIGTTSDIDRFAANFNIGALGRVSSFGVLDIYTNTSIIAGSLPWQNLNTTANTGITVDESFTLTPGATWSATVDGTAYLRGFIFYNVDEPWAEVNNETH